VVQAAVPREPLNYHDPMNMHHHARALGNGSVLPLTRASAHTATQHLRRAALAIALTAAFWQGPACAAQPAAPRATQPTRAVSEAFSNAEAMYLVLVGEMQIAARQTGVGFSLILEAAKKSGDPELFRRAVNVALESRAVDAAKEAARAWSAAIPSSPDPYRVLLQLMLATNEVAQSAEPLKQLLTLVPDTERSSLIDMVAQSYARTNDRETAKRVALTALQPWLQRTDTAASAWAATGLLSLVSGQKKAAMDALSTALTSPAKTDAPGLLAVDLLNAKEPEAEPLLLAHLKASPTVAVRMAYMRHLLDNDRAADARQQLVQATQQDPSSPEQWLLLGALDMQQNQLDSAEKHFLRFLELSSKLDAERAVRATTQAYLSLAQIAESRKQFAESLAWLDRIDSDEETIRVQLQRASLLAHQGQLTEARALIRQIPEQKPADARTKLSTELQLLKEANQLSDAFALLKAAADKEPDDADLAYDLAMLADKMGDHAEMERILRALIARKPDHHHAYNALGYSLADRNLRLPEAKALIQKALELAPGDPFITDSLGWVEYRLGNLAEAARLLRLAYEKRPDVEIALHLGEVLWVLGERDAARTAFVQAKALQSDNAALKEVLQRLGVRL